MLLHRLTDRDGQTYYLLSGPEPDYQWERVVEAVRELVVRLGVTLVVHTHGIPMAVPHTRPVGMTAHATDSALIGDTASPFGRVQVPGSIGALLELRLGEAGHQAVGFAIHVPHYLAGSEWAEGALASLNAVVDVTGLNLPNDDLGVTGLEEVPAEDGLDVAGVDERTERHDEHTRTRTRQVGIGLEAVERGGVLHGTGLSGGGARVGVNAHPPLQDSPTGTRCRRRRWPCARASPRSGHRCRGSVRTG